MKEINIQDVPEVKLPPYKCIHTPEERDKLARPGEKLGSRMSAHNDVLYYALMLLNCIVPGLEEMVYKKERFRAEIYFDPEADKFEFLTFVKDDSSNTDQED